MPFKQFLMLAAAGAVLAGCGGSGAGLVGQQEPRIRLFNGVDGQQAITAVYKDPSLSVLGTSTSAQFGALSNDTIVTNTNVTATVSTSGGMALFTTAATQLRNGSDYSVYAAGTAPNYKGLVLQDSQSASAAGTIGIRVVDVGSNTAAVDVYLEPNGPTLSNLTPLFTNLTFGNVSAAANATQAVDSNGYIVTAITNAGSYYFVITAHGSTTVIGSVQTTAVQGNYETVAVFDTNGAPGGTSAAVLTDNRTN